MEIKIGKVNVSDNEVQFKLQVSRPLRNYFLTDTSYVRYDSAIDLKKVGHSVLAIPMVSLIAPIAWAVGADVLIEELDAAYLQALGKIRDVFQGFHPQFSFSTTISVRELILNEFGGDRSGLLFSGGVDSLTSYLRHRDEKPDLVSIWGLPDIPPFEEKFWSRMWADICSLANHEGVRAFQVKTDMWRNINRELLGKRFGVLWYGGVAAGLWLLGLSAPVTAARGIKTMIIASSYTADYVKPRGFHPLIDHNVSWADVRVVHDGYELSRQQKLQYLCRRENLDHLSNLRVCRDSALRTNCGNCEKCFRTIAGLVAAGVNPSQCNFDVDTKTLPRIKDCFIKGKMALREGELFMWGDIQRHLPEHIDTDILGSGEFLRWLREFDLSQYKRNRVRSSIWAAHRLYSNKKIKAPSIRRKAKCYFHIVLDNLRFS